MDIATGYFEIGSLLALDGQWQKLERIRILMGDEVSKRTRKALLAGVEDAKRKLDESIEREKEKNDFLSAVPAIVEALRRKQIECRAYTKDKVHAVDGPPPEGGSGPQDGRFYPRNSENFSLRISLRAAVQRLRLVMQVPLPRRKHLAPMAGRSCQS